MRNQVTRKYTSSSLGRYIDILRRKQYPKVEEFLTYGNALWDKVRDLPCGYCHGDMYDGNIHKTPDGKFYMLDFDTSCEGFPMYDQPSCLRIFISL